MAAARTPAWCAEIGFNLMWLDWLKDGSETGSMRELQLMTHGWTGLIVSNQEENVFSLQRGKRRKGQRRMQQLRPTQNVFLLQLQQLGHSLFERTHRIYIFHLTLAGWKPAAPCWSSHPSMYELGTSKSEMLGFSSVIHTLVGTCDYVTTPWSPYSSVCRALPEKEQSCG